MVSLLESPTPHHNHHTTSVSLHLQPSGSWKTKPNNSKQNKAIQYYIVQSINPSQYHIVQKCTPPLVWWKLWLSLLKTALVKFYNIQVIPSTKFKLQIFNQNFHLSRVSLDLINNSVTFLPLDRLCLWLHSARYQEKGNIAEPKLIFHRWITNNRR